MLMKRIRCKVDAEQRENFSQAQEKWKALQKVDGLITQIGGWSLDEPTVAVILALWRTEESYHHFMTSIHDSIYKETNQTATFTFIQVDVMPVEIDGPFEEEYLIDQSGERFVMEESWSIKFFTTKETC